MIHGPETLLLLEKPPTSGSADIIALLLMVSQHNVTRSISISSFRVNTLTLNPQEVA